jgi:penicillin-binding protein 1B
MRVRVPRGSGLTRFLLGPVGRTLVAGFLFFTFLGLGVFTYFYVRYARVIDDKLRTGVFANSAKIFAAPETVGVGDILGPGDIAAGLRRSGYNESRSNPIGYYQMGGNSIEIFPGKDSYFEQEAGVIRFARGKISQIVSLQDNTARSLYQLEPQLLTSLSGPAREKRRIVKFRDIPTVLVQAVTSAEDKRFFQHAGFDPIRIIKAVYVDLKEGRMAEGASTLTMQLAREFWLDQDKRWGRKAAEAIITLQLEQKLSKEEIFEDYCNQIYLGYRGSFRIRGFGEAAEAFLGKDLSQITVPEAAELAGLPRWPAYFDPYRHPDHAKDRRNVVLGLMRANGYITDREYAVAIETPLTAARGASQSVEAPYFVDLLSEDLQSRFQDENFQSNNFRVYTTLDMRLQRAAQEAVRKGMVLVDEQIKKQKRFKGVTPPEPQVALVAMDPHTGEVKAVVGGRNYGVSQLNHVMAKRQPGSIFKPFVYAAAFQTGIDNRGTVITPSTIVTDEPTTFWYDGRPYEPSNFGHEFYGDVTLRFALAHSLNVATVKVAQMTGFDQVVAMANRGGMNYKIQPTPSVALGAYEITPLEAVGAYTLFANRGMYVKPSFLRMVRDGKDGKMLFKHVVDGKPDPQHYLDPRVSYLVTSLMEEVVRSGTGAGVRSYIGGIPAAGKTGTSHDGWFSGFTSQLLCVVWVGFDDNKELNLEGAKSAAPIWAEFMKSALAYREYRDTNPFLAPDGIVSIEIDPESGMPSTLSCPKEQKEYYIAGSEPVGACPLHGGRTVITNVSGWETAPADKPPARTSSAPPADSGGAPRFSGSAGDGQIAPGAIARRAARQEPPDSSAGATAQPDQPDDDKKATKKGFWSKIKGVFKK